MPDPSVSLCDELNVDGYVHIVDEVLRSLIICIDEGELDHYMLLISWASARLRELEDHVIGSTGSQGKKTKQREMLASGIRWCLVKPNPYFLFVGRTIFVSLGWTVSLMNTFDGNANMTFCMLGMNLSCKVGSRNVWSQTGSRALLDCTRILMACPFRAMGFAPPHLAVDEQQLVCAFRALSRHRHPDN